MPGYNQNNHAGREKTCPSCCVLSLMEAKREGTPTLLASLDAFRLQLNFLFIMQYGLNWGVCENEKQLGRLFCKRIGSSLSGVRWEFGGD